MSGYTRQSAADIIPTAVVRAAPINAEFNALRDAFDFDDTGVTGHKHDGTADQGSYVPLIADVDGKNKLVVDTINNRVNLFVEVATVSTEQLRFQDGVVVPVINNDIDLGTSGSQFKDLYLDGTAKVDLLTVDENATIAGSLTVDGNVVLGDAATDTVTVNADIASSLIPSVDSTYTLGDGSNYWSHAYVDAITTTGNVTIGGNLTVTSTVDMTNDRITNMANPTANQDATTKLYVDTADALKLNLSGGTMSGAIAMGANKITGLANPTSAQDAATKIYVDTSISSLIDSAPGALDTLNELAAALGDDPNFATTVTNELATKLPLAGGTMTGDITLNANKVTSTATPLTDDTLTRKGYVDTQDALKLNLAGGTMSGDIAMGGNKVTGLGAPTLGNDATTKTYVDGILGSATAAATSAAEAAASAAAAADSFDSFDDRYLGAKSSAPTTDNDGDPLLTGALYWNTVSNSLFVWSGSTWDPAAFNVAGALFESDIGVTVQGYDATILNEADIGVTVQGYDATILNEADIGVTVQGYDATILNEADIGVTVQGYDANTAKLDVAQTFTANQTVSAEFIATSYNETFVTLTGTTPSVNCETGNNFTFTTSGNTAFTFSNPPASGTAYGFTLKVTAGGTHTLTWPASVDWPGGTAPDAPASGETDVFVFYTVDGGTNWYGFQAGDALA